MKKIFALGLAVALVASSAQGFRLGDLKDKDRLKDAAKVAAVVVAAKVLTDMVIEHRTKTLSKEDKVAKEYKAKHKELPELPLATSYTTDTLPGKVVEPGKKIMIRSDIVVVPGTQQTQTLIEETINIYDNEDHSKKLNTLTKAVNDKTKRAGHYQNEFSFTLPEGLPQGVYPIKTELLIDGKSVQTSSNDIQLVLHVDQNGAFELLAAAY